MDPSRWQYLAEGGEHAVFEEKFPSAGSSNQLLRIKKRDLVICDKVASFCLLETEGHDDEAKQANGAKSKTYLEKVIAPLLAPYVDVPVTIQLEWFFLVELKRQSIEKGCIPKARKKDWNLQSSRKGDEKLGSIDVVEHAYAQLVPDYRMLPMTPNVSSYDLVPSTVLSVELKPKAGYVAFSPLVQPKNRVKYKHSRYVLKQRLYQLEHQRIQSGWSRGQVQPSKFDPLDLYSGNAERIQHAIRELFRCPQNNLRVTCNQQLFLSKGKDGSPIYSENAEVLCKDLLSDLVVTDGVSFPSTIEEAICTWLLAVFQQEDVLQRLQKMQKLDILDADGAILLYNRLVELCNDCHEEAQSLLDKVATSEESGRKSPLKSSPFSSSQGHESDLLPRICRQVKDFETTLLDSIPELPSEDILDRYHEEMVEMISSLNVFDCQHLLWNWLLSLTLSDVSMFITFQQMRVPSDVLDSSQLASSEDHGILKVPLKGKAPLCLAYTLRIVDCDGKPSKKLRTRWKKEEPFSLLSK